MADPAGQLLEVEQVHALALGGRVRLRERGDHHDPVLVVRIHPEPDRDPTQAGRGRGVGGDDAEQLLQGAAAGLGVAGEDLALGGPVAVGDDQRGHLGPEEDPAAKLGEGHRVEAPVVDGVDAGIPDQPADHGEPGEEQHVADSLACRDAPGRALHRHRRLEVEPPVADQAAGLVHQVVERLCPEPRPAWPPSHAGRETRPGPLALDDRSELLQGDIDLADERRGDDAGADLVQWLAQLEGDRDGQRLVVGHGGPEHGPDRVLGCDRHAIAPPVAPWRQSGPRGFAPATVGPTRKGAHYEPCHLGMARGGRCSP